MNNEIHSVNLVGRKGGGVKQRYHRKESIWKLRMSHGFYADDGLYLHHLEILSLSYLA